MPLAIVSLAACIIGLVACKKETPSEPAPAAQTAPAAAPGAAAKGATGAGSIAGTVKLTGTPPEMQMTKRQADPYCAKTPMKDEEVVVAPNGTLKNVIVRVTAGLTGHYDPPAASATVDQSACMYRPRVQGIMLGQPLKITNSDQTLHNIHGYRGASTLFNQAQIPGSPAIEKKFADNNTLIKFKCDVHPWMLGYVMVQNNPFFAVTGDDGSFKIADVPPGEYTVEAWHEKLGTKTAKLTVAAGKPAELKFDFAAK